MSASSTRRFIALLVAVCVLLISVSPVWPQSNDIGEETFTNPLNISGGPDPWLQYYEGNYYLATTTGASTLNMRMAPTIAGLKTAQIFTIYFEADPSRCCNMWAPEFHLLESPEDGSLHWYYYYSAGTAGTLDNQRTHVLESEGTDPMGPYTYKGRLFDPARDVWAIDGSVLLVEGNLYFLYSSWVGEYQSLYIAPMSNPWTISGPAHLLSRPEYDWEQVGLNVNEGPVALYHDDDIFIVYSASFCNTPDYKLGILTYNGGDPLLAASWEKSPDPVFERSDENGVFGPGHNGFFQSPDGTQDWIVYHANDSTDDGCTGVRTTRVQPFTWNADGTPDFGVPVSADTAVPLPSGDPGSDRAIVMEMPTLSRFEVYGLEGAFLRHNNLIMQTGFQVTPLGDSQFVVVPGLADPEAVSLESFNMPGYYVRQQGNQVLLSSYDGGESFAAETTWWLRSGLSDPEWTSFESYTRPGHYIGQLFGVIALSPINESSPARARNDATFREVR